MRSTTTLEATIRRGLDLPPIDQSHHIALISEWDTLYGRALPDTMARCLGQPACEPPNGDPFRGKDWLHPFKYLRGLDGQMPNADGSSSGNSPRDNGNKQDKDSKDNAKSRPDPRAKDRAEGQSQFDYLNRLGDQNPAIGCGAPTQESTRHRGRRSPRLRRLRQVAGAAGLAAAVAERVVLHHRSRCLAAASGGADPHPQSSGCFELRFAARVRHPGRDPAVPEWLPDRTIPRDPRRDPQREPSQKELAAAPLAVRDRDLARVSICPFQRQAGRNRATTSRNRSKGDFQIRSG